MGEIDKVYLKQRGYLKFIEIVLGCFCIAMFHGGLYGPYSNMSIEWSYPFTYNFNMAVGGIMISLETIILSVYALVFQEDLGGYKLFYKLDLYLCCLMGSVLYVVVTILGVGHWGWPRFNYSSSIDWHLVVAVLFAAANLSVHIYESYLNLRDYGWTRDDPVTHQPLSVSDTVIDIIGEEEEEKDDVNENEKANTDDGDEKKPITDFIEPSENIESNTEAVEQQDNNVTA